MIHLDRVLLGFLAATAMAAPACAQTFVGDAWTESRRDRSNSITAQLNRQSGFNTASERELGPAIEFADLYANHATLNPYAAVTTHDVWFAGDGYSDRLRISTHGELRRADGAPLPISPLDHGAYQAEGYDLSYTRDWPVARGYTASGLEVTLTPHAGLGVGDWGGTAEAGATLKIGRGIDRLVPEGSAAFGQRARWYLYAAGSGTAVGYNFARNRDGDYARSGVSRDRGNFLGDASVGVALRRGDMQGSLGVIYREIRAEGIHSGGGIDNDVTEGLVAFQLSIKPAW